MRDEYVNLSHGAGGDAMHRLIKQHFVERFAAPALQPMADAALLELPASRIAFTTDSYVVKPLEFPGGSIGTLAVCGTVNDLAVMGARPLHLSCAFILEEGLPLALLDRIVTDMRAAAQQADVAIVTGDTKVVPRGECDGMFINTAGIGALPPGGGLCANPIAEGDAIIVSGTLGDHGIAILSAREGLAFESEIRSDCAPLAGMIRLAAASPPRIKWMRDPTRGGLAAVLTELAESARMGVLLRENTIPVRDDVAAICELLGFDPLHLANEGKVVMVAAAADANAILHELHRHPLGVHAAQIGEITAVGSPQVLIETSGGGTRRLQRPAGELLPRIC